MAGDYERHFERDGVRYRHILDPVARDGLRADGLDTGIFGWGMSEG